MAHHETLTATKGKRWRSWLPWTVGLIGVLLSLLVFVSLQRTAIEHNFAQFRNEARIRTELINRELQTAMQFINVVPIYYENSRNIDREEFAGFSTALMRQQPQLESCSWAPAVRRGDLAGHVEQTLADVPDYELSLDESSQAPWLFPVVYQEGSPHLKVGQNLVDDPRFSEALGRAQRGEPAAVEPHGDSQSDSLLMYLILPCGGSAEARSPSQPSPGPNGVIIGSIDVAKMVRDLLPHWKSEGFRVAIDCNDGQVIEAFSGDGDKLSDRPFSHPLGVAGVRLDLVIQPTRAYVGRQMNNRVPFLSLTLGLLLSALSISMLRRLIGRTTKIESLVHQRTQELQESNQQFELQVKEREQVEDALSESLAAYQSLIESLPLNVFRKDLSGLIVDANQRFCDTINHTLEETVGQSDFDLFPLAQAKKFRDDDQRVLATGEVLEDIEEHVKNDGARIYVHVLKAPARDAKGEIVGVQGMFWDVTSRVLAEEARTLSDAKFRRLVESDIVGVMTASLDGRVLQANDEFLRIIQRERSELDEGTLRWDTLTPEEYRELDDDAIQQLEETGACRPWEKEYLRKDGSRISVLIGVAAIDQSFDECICWILDITERKRMEDELKRAKETADSASQAKSQFLANMSHEIRTPMNAVIGMTELVLNSPLSTEQRDYLKMVLHSGEALLGVINDILDFSKVEAGKLEIEAKPFHLLDTIGDAMKSLALRAHAKQIELACDISPHVPTTLVGDGGRVRQVILNLVGNSIKFTEHGEVVLSVDVQHEDDHAVVLHVQVRDTGIGIPLGKQAQVFAAFEQADATTTRRFGGTGLGLAITRRLVDLMGGKLWVESEEGLGSTFHFTVLMERCADLPAADWDTKFDASQAAVLIVDDSATNRKILSRIFASWDVEHVTAAGALPAMEHLAKRDFSVVIADANMPDGDGFSLIRQMRTLPSHHQTPVIILTSGEMPHDRQQCDELGVSSHLLKPVKKSELYDALVAALASRDAVVFQPAHHQEPEEFRSLKILLAEDSAVNQMLAKVLLERDGHTVTIAHNGREAVQLVASMRFDLVLMDVQMPVQDGLDASMDIRRREKIQNKARLPIVALTAHAMKGDREKCLEAGMDEYLSKPIRAADLYATIRRATLASDANLAATNVTHDLAETQQINLPPISSPAMNGVQDLVTAPQESPGSPTPGDLTLTTGSPLEVDWSTALAAVNGSEDLLRELSSIFDAEGPRLLSDAQAAYERGDGPGVKIAAHTLKGSARYFGNTPVGKYAADLEKMAAAGSLDDAGDTLTQIQSALPRLLSALKLRFSNE
jgi:two-component system sensor histidine kinase/response regulator